MTTATLQETKNRTLKQYAGSARNIQFRRVPLSKLHIDVDLNVREDASYTAENMNELKESIRAAGGIWQPLTVMPIDETTVPAELRKAMEGKEYTVMAGFRRALNLQDLAAEDPAFGQNVPVVVTNTSGDQGVFKLIQIIENLQRQQLSPLETARGFQSMIEDSDIQLTHQEVADAAGISRPHVTQYLLLLKLPKEIQEKLANKKITFTHCRVLMMAPQGEDFSIWKELAKMAEGMTADRFRREVNRQYHIDADQETVEKKKPEGGTQRVTIKSRKPTEVNNVYIPYFQAKVKEAKDKNDQGAVALWSHRLDTLAWLYCNDKSQLSKELETWEKERIEKEAEEKKTKDAIGKKDKYINALVSEVFKTLSAPQDDLEAPRPTLPQALSAVKANLELQIKKAGEEKKTPTQHFGFEWKSVDDFMEEVKAAVKETQAKRKKARLVKAAKDAWKKAYLELRKQDLTAEQKQEAQTNLQSASDDLKKQGVDPAEHEKAFIENEKKEAEAKKNGGGKKKGKKGKKEAASEPAAATT